MQTPLAHSRWVCRSCLDMLRSAPRSAQGILSGGGRTPKRLRSDNAAQDRQAIPLSGYYAELLNNPSSRLVPPTHTPPAPPPPDQLPKTTQEETLERARQVFGSRLSGPAERADELRRASVNIAGVLVPPKPEEPDNCCMSGCVNCVWDRFRDEFEEWASKSAEARAKVLAQRQQGTGTGTMTSEAGMPHHVATSMDDDGGGSEANWDSGAETSGQGGDLFQNIPVGIREFMRTEKLLRKKHGGDEGQRSLASNIRPSESGRNIQWVR